MAALHADAIIPAGGLLLSKAVRERAKVDMRQSGVCKYLVTLSLLLIITAIAGTADANSKITTPSSCPATLTQGSPGVSYAYTFLGNAGTSWTIIAGSLPPGLTLNGATGILSGTPTAIGTYNFTIQFNATGGVSASCGCTLAIAGCSFVNNISSGNISFGSIDPSGSATIYGNVNQQVSFVCPPNGTAYTVTMNPASGWSLASGSNSIPYTVGVAPIGSYSGSAVNLLIPSGAGASSMAPVNFQNVPAGTYTNTTAIQMTVTWSGGSIVATLPAGSVSGAVINTCKVTTPGTLTFNLDPSVTGTSNATISPDMQLNCTKGDSVSISASSQNGGSSPMLLCTSPATCGSFQIPYTFKLLNTNAWPVSVPPSSLTGFGGAGVSLGISGSANSTDYANAPIGSYGDIQTLTISY